MKLCHVVCSLVVFLAAGHFALPLLAQEKLPKGFKQYKRVHQDALKKIVDGEATAAIEDLDAVIAAVPEDAESHYMLAVAHAAAGNDALAVRSVENAVAAGLPIDRFVAGTKLGLESLQDHAVFRSMKSDLAHQPAHGPMLGCIAGSSVKVWLRTADEAAVTVTVWESDNPRKRITSQPTNTKSATDYTAVVDVSGLQPNTRYAYSVRIDGKPYREDSYRFRTLADRGQPVKFRLAFGGGAGFVPQHEYMWNTIRAEQPDVLVLLGDNVYSDAPKIPEMQNYCYYRRQSRPEYRQLIASTPVFSIWDDHDFGTNDCSGGPALLDPYWKMPVYKVFRNNWVNPYYGGGEQQPGCNCDFYLGDVHFIMLDGRYYRDLKDPKLPTMLGPVQREWLMGKIKGSQGKLVVLCSPVPWVFRAKGDSKDTWNGFKEERKLIFDALSKHNVEGVILMSADRHRSDLWKIERADDYDLYELNSSRLTNQHVHKEMPQAIFSYNKKQSFGTVDIDTTLNDPTVTYRIVAIDGEEIHRHTIKRSQLTR